jgi:hypothetical protein
VQDGQKTWDSWFKPYFQLVHNESYCVRATSYINWNWTTSQWATWGDAEVQNNKVIGDAYTKEMARPEWIHLDQDPMSKINLKGPSGPTPPTPPTPVAPTPTPPAPTPKKPTPVAPTPKQPTPGPSPSPAVCAAKCGDKHCNAKMGYPYCCGRCSTARHLRAAVSLCINAAFLNRRYQWQLLQQPPAGQLLWMCQHLRSLLSTNRVQAAWAWGGGAIAGGVGRGGEPSPLS